VKIRPGCFLLNTEEKPGGYVPGVCPGLFMADSSKKIVAFLYPELYWGQIMNII
jgi:hypothetical protein